MNKFTFKTNLGTLQVEGKVYVDTLKRILESSDQCMTYFSLQESYKRALPVDKKQVWSCIIIKDDNLDSTLACSDKEIVYFTLLFKGLQICCYHKKPEIIPQSKVGVAGQ
jgi:hypothetical protein